MLGDSPEERQIHFGPDGPVAAARNWLEAIVRKDVRSAWRATDPDYRLALTQAIIFLNQEHPSLMGSRENRSRTRWPKRIQATLYGSRSRTFSPMSSSTT